MKHPDHPPSPYATVEVRYGAEYKHLYSTSEDEIAYHATREAAVKAAKEIVGTDANAIVAIVKIEELIAAKVEPQTVCQAKSFSRR